MAGYPPAAYAAAAAGAGAFGHFAHQPWYVLYTVMYSQCVVVMIEKGMGFG